jgi:hypothetical protein
MAGIITVTFGAGARGDWQIQRVASVTGEGLPMARRLSMSEAAKNGR